MASWKIRGTTHLWLPRPRLIPSHFCQTYSIQHLCSIACTSISACTFVIQWCLYGFGDSNLQNFWCEACGISNIPRSNHVILCFNKSWRAEPTKEAFVRISFVSKRPTELPWIISGGRAEPMKKANQNRFFMAQVTMELMKSVRMVDVPSNQRRWLDLDSLMRKSTMELMKSVRMVDVPRFELGASTMPR